MAGFATKTPVSSLQEYLISKKLVPKYELIYDGKGTHNPQFTFQVQVGDISADGSGRSKQEAKHRAAEKMLRRLTVVDDGNDVCEEKNESEQDPVENYVGQLKNLCCRLHYPEPKYMIEEEGGPPHSKIFKMICCVSQLQESGIYRTKKQAKQQAAYKMIQRLREVGGEKIKEALAHPETLNRCYSKSASALLTDAEVVDKYCTIRPNGAPVENKDFAAFYKDHYKAYVGLEENSPTLKKMLNENILVNLENSISLVQEIAKELEVTVSTGKIQSQREENKDFTILTMSLTPPVGEIGNDEENAACNLLLSLMALSRD